MEELHLNQVAINDDESLKAIVTGNNIIQILKKNKETNQYSNWEIIEEDKSFSFIKFQFAHSQLGTIIIALSSNECLNLYKYQLTSFEENKFEKVSTVHLANLIDFDIVKDSKYLKLFLLTSEGKLAIYQNANYNSNKLDCLWTTRLGSSTCYFIKSYSYEIDKTKGNIIVIGSKRKEELSILKILESEADETFKLVKEFQIPGSITGIELKQEVVDNLYYLAVGVDKGDVLIFQKTNKWDQVALIKINSSINQLIWNNTGTVLTILSNDGEILYIRKDPENKFSLFK